MTSAGKVGFETVNVVVGRRNVESVAMCPTNIGFKLRCRTANSTLIPASRVRVWLGYRFSYPYPYPCLPVACTRAGFHTRVDHYVGERLRMHKSISVEWSMHRTISKNTAIALSAIPFCSCPVGHSCFVKDPVMFAEVIQDVLYKFCPVYPT